MSDVVCCIMGARHGTQCHDDDTSGFGFFACRFQQFIQLPGIIPYRFGFFHFISEMMHEIPESGYLIFSGRLVHTVDKRGDLPGFLVFFPVYEFGNFPVGQQHEFFDQPMGVQLLFHMNIYRFPLFISFYFYFRSFKSYRPPAETFFSEPVGQCMEKKQSVPDRFGDRAGTCLHSGDLIQYRLGLFVRHPAG